MMDLGDIFKPTDDEIRAMPTTDIQHFVTWRAFAGKPEHGWLDAIDFENEAYVDALLASEPEDQEALSLR